MAISNEEWKIVDDAFHNTDPSHDISSALRDCFALGCYIHLKGHKVAGEKAVWSALQAAKLHKTHTKIYSKILKELDGNELEFINKIRAHSEINDLIG